MGIFDNFVDTLGLVVPQGEDPSTFYKLYQMSREGKFVHKNSSVSLFQNNKKSGENANPNMPDLTGTFALDADMAVAVARHYGFKTGDFDPKNYSGEVFVQRASAWSKKTQNDQNYISVKLEAYPYNGERSATGEPKGQVKQAPAKSEDDIF